MGPPIGGPDFLGEKMKKEVKILSLILSVCICIGLCGCNNTDPVGNSSVSSSSAQPQLTVPTDSYVSSAPTVESTPEPEPTPESKPASVPQQTTTPTPAPTPSAPVDLGGNFTVNDPDNALGRSNQRYPFSFGGAKNEQPHSISVSNQARFDSLDGVNALALDTVSTDRRMYLTFDCGYEYNNLTASILDTLKEKNVKSAFFCTLDYLKKNPHLVRRMIDEGHIVGNHSATHPDFTKNLSRTQMAKELYIVHKYLADNYNYTSKYFRFPTGANSDNALELVTSVGYRSVFWSIAHTDWDTSKQPTDDAAFSIVTERYHPGAVILLHAVSSANTNVLGRLIDTAHERGYTFTTLDEYPWN